MVCLLAVTQIFLSLIPLLLAQDSEKALSELVEELLSNDEYRSRIRPGADSGLPLTVYLDININDISSISAVKMEYSLTMFLRQTWRDERLAYTGHNRSITLNYNQFARIWTPDLFIRNLKHGQFHEITVPNRLIRLSPDGTVLYSQRLSVTLACDMQLEKYPMDNQTCKIEFGSYGYTTDDLILEWKAVEHPVEVNFGISLPEYFLLGVQPDTCVKDYATTGSFPCLQTFLTLQRRLKFYILQTYLPSLLIVLLSWVSFWIDLDAVPARTSLGILTILTITTQSAGVSNGLPAVSFTKAIDVWMATCLVFVFGAFIEYSVVNVLARRHKKQKREEDKFKIMAATLATSVANLGQKDPSKHVTVSLPSPSTSDPSTDHGSADHRGLRQRLLLKNGRLATETSVCRRQPKQEGNWWQRAQHNQALMADVVSRILFPVLFIIFQIIYWPLYIIN